MADLYVWLVLAPDDTVRAVFRRPETAIDSVKVSFAADLTERGEDFEVEDLGEDSYVVTCGSLTKMRVTKMYAHRLPVNIYTGELA